MSYCLFLLYYTVAVKGFLCAFIHKQGFYFPKKHDLKCSHNICSLLGNSTVKMQFGMHCGNSGQGTSMKCSYCSSRSCFNTWLFNIL